MTAYDDLVRKMTSTETEMNFLKSAHKQHVFKFLSDIELELSRVNMSLIWDSSNEDMSSGLYQVQVLDGQPVFEYEVDAYCHMNFSFFKHHFEETLKPYVLKKMQKLELDANLKPKLQTKARLKI